MPKGYSISYIVSRDGLDCHWCGKAVRRYEVSRDHVITRDRGGPNCLNNYVVTHPECNNKRGNARYLDWCQQVGREPDEAVIIRVFQFNSKCGHCNMRAQAVRQQARKRNKRIQQKRSLQGQISAKQTRREAIIRRLEELNILPSSNQSEKAS